jgi:hypothetical protein
MFTMIILVNLKIKIKIRHHIIGGEAGSSPFYLKLRVRLEMEMFQIK